MTRLGIVGTGNMARNHLAGFSVMRDAEVHACCDVDEARAAAFAAKWKIPRAYGDYRRMLAEERLDGVVNVTPDPLHAPISLAAIAKGLPILCEKPLATSLAEARRMRDAADRSGVVAMVNFTYRNAAALQAAARYIAAGHIGRVIHVEASYLQSWLVQPAWGDWHTDPGWQWRLSTAHGSQGVLGDIGCHIYDFAAFLCGDIAEIYCRLGTYDKGVKGNRIGPYRFDANDSFISNVTFANGAIGTIHASRWATGHINSVRARVYGDKGAVDVDLDRSETEFLAVKGRADARNGTWTAVKAPARPTNYARFIRAIKTGRPDPSDFANGTRVQAYLHCSFESDRRRRPVKVSF